MMSFSKDLIQYIMFTYSINTQDIVQAIQDKYKDQSIFRYHKHCEYDGVAMYVPKAYRYIDMQLQDNDKNVVEFDTPLDGICFCGPLFDLYGRRNHISHPKNNNVFVLLDNTWYETSCNTFVSDRLIETNSILIKYSNEVLKVSCTLFAPKKTL
jgi:hypothetical protein